MLYKYVSNLQLKLWNEKQTNIFMQCMDKHYDEAGKMTIDLILPERTGNLGDFCWLLRRWQSRPKTHKANNKKRAHEI